MPTPAYLSITGKKQKEISMGCSSAESIGNKWQEDHQDEIMVQAFKHNIHLPTDPQSGQPSGQRVHGPITITKTFDKSSPLLYNALASGEIMTSCEIKWYRTSSTGLEENYFIVKLEDAIIVDIQSYMPNCQDTSQAHLTHMEDVSISYRKITWNHAISNTEGSDDWRKRAMAN